MSAGGIYVGLGAFAFTDGGAVTRYTPFNGWRNVYAGLWSAGGGAMTIGWAQRGNLLGSSNVPSPSFPERHTFNLKRTGNLWTCTVDGGSIDLGSWADDTMRDAPIKLWVSRFAWSTGAYQGRVGSIVVNAGDTDLETE
jgi:hypothetical protein